jgi:RNA polymerase sigma factor FliA
VSRDALIEQYQDFTRTVAASVIRKMALPSGMLDELISAGYLGLVEAADRFREGAGTSFRDYAFYRIKGSMIDFIRGNSEVSGAAYQQAKAYRAAVELRAETQFAPGPKSEQLARVLEYAAKTVLAFRCSFEEVEEELTENHSPPDGEALYFQYQDRKLLRELVKGLPDREREVIEQYYFYGKSFAELVDEEQGRSKSWVSRLHARGLELLKKRYLKAINYEAE